MKERVQKLMAMANVGSRRACETLIEQGRVRVNSQIATLGDKADPEVDVIEVDGVRLTFDQRRVYFAFHKPKQVLVTAKPHGTDARQTVHDFLPYEGHLFSIGRLDADSEGLVIMTNDGELAQKLTHPRFRHTKTYRVTIQGLPTADTIQKWSDGVYLDEVDGRTAPCIVEVVKGGTKESVLRIVMTEGKKRQIRRVGNALGHRVVRLIRTQIGMLELGNLAEGQYRELTDKDVEQMSSPAPEFKAFLSDRARERRYGGAPRPSSDRDARSSRAPQRRDDDSRPPRRFGEGDRPGPRREGDSRPPRRFGEGDRPGPRREGDSRPPRRYGEGDRPRRDDDSRPPRRFGEGDRPGPRREGDSRPPRRYGEGDRPRRDDDSRPPRRFGEGDRPGPRREGDSRPPRRYGEGDRPGPRRDDDSRPPRRFGEGDRPGPRRDDDSRPPRRFGEGDRPGPRRDDDSRPPRRSTGGSGGRPGQGSGSNRSGSGRPGQGRPGQGRPSKPSSGQSNRGQGGRTGNRPPGSRPRKRSDEE